MNVQTPQLHPRHRPGTDLLATAETLGQRFAARAAEADAEDRFVAENYRELKEAGLVDGRRAQANWAAAAPAFRELAEMLRILAHHCSSTALAFSMHTHQVAIPAWRWQTQKVAAMEPLLKRIAAEKLVLLSSGGSDWIPGSGRAEKRERRLAHHRPQGLHQRCAGRRPADDRCRRAGGGRRPVVLHFGIPMSSPHVQHRADVEDARHARHRLA